AAGRRALVEGAGAGFGAEDRELFGGRVDESGLGVGTGGQGGIEGRAVPVAAPLHLGDEGLVPPVEGGETSFPAARFRMAAVAGSVEGEDVPERVQLAVLAEEVAPAEERRVHVPDPHGIGLAGSSPGSP